MINFKDKKFGYIIIALVIILLLLLVFVFLSPERKTSFLDKSKDDVKSEEELFEEMKEEMERDRHYFFDQEAENNREWNENDFKQIARSFSERFGSFSNHSDYGNIEDLYILMSSEMKGWAIDYVSELRANREYTGDFYGMTTSALAEPVVKSLDKEGGKVEVLVSTQREEISSVGENRVYSQDILVTFTKERGNWLVNSAFWQ
jgi:hypothetical protein